MLKSLNVRQSAGQRESHQPTDTRKHLSEKSRSGINIRVIENEHDFTELAGEWDELVKKTGSPLFVTFEWLSGWWKFFGRHKHRKLHILAFYVQDRLIGLAPFYTAVSILFGRVIERRLKIMGTGRTRSELFGHYFDKGISDFVDVIAEQEFSEHIAEALTLYLKDRPNYFDILHLRPVKKTGFIMQHLTGAFKRHSLSFTMEKEDVCLVVHASRYKSFNHYVSTRSRLARRRLRRSLRNNDSGSHYIVRHCLTQEQKRHACYHLIRLHQKRWNEIGQPGKFFDPEYQFFFRHITESFIQTDRLNVIMAEDNGQCIGVNLGIEFEQVHYGFLNAFDMEAPSAKYAPGIGLLTESFRDAFERNFRKIEFLQGSEKYKFDYTSEFDTSYRIRISTGRPASFLRKALMGIFYGIARIRYRCKTETRFLRAHFISKGISGIISGYLITRILGMKNGAQVNFKQKFSKLSPSL